MTTQTPELTQAAVASFNDGDLGAFAELLEPDALMCPDPSWPEQGPFQGREAVMSFVADWIAPWESVELAVDGQEEHGDWVVARCRWLTTGKASGAATEVPFTFLIQARAGRIATIKAFFDHAEALRSLA